MLSQEAQGGRSPQQWQPRTTIIADDCQRPKLQHDAPSTKPSFVWQHFSLTGGVRNGKKNPNKKYKTGNSLDINARLARPLWKKHNSTPDLSLKVGGWTPKFVCRLLWLHAKLRGRFGKKVPNRAGADGANARTQQGQCHATRDA